MTSTYTSNQGIEKPATGDQSGTWGGTVNTNMDIIDRAISGVGALTLTGSTTTLTTTDGTLTDGMYRVLVLGDGGDLGSDNTLTISPNDQDKAYLVYNNLTANRNAIFSQGTGANATVANGATAWIYADGAGSGAAVRIAMLSTEISDQDGDTKIQVEEGGDDDDTIRFDTGGSERMTIASGGTVDVVGDLTAGTLNADGDTSAGDAAAFGYTSVLGAIITGQGSTSDVTLVNDADATVLSIPTGTTNVTIVGDLTVNGVIFDDETLDIYDEGTWSPILRPYSVVFDSITYDSLRYGSYVIIGHLCHFEWAMRTDAITVGSGSGGPNIAGLPVAPLAQSNFYRAFKVYSLSGFAGEFPAQFSIASSNLLGALGYSADTTSGWTATVIADLDTGADKNWCTCVGTYETA